jgi:hypothetical protein
VKAGTLHRTWAANEQKFLTSRIYGNNSVVNPEIVVVSICLAVGWDALAATSCRPAI